MSTFENRDVLVLNKSWSAINVWPLRKALTKLISYYGDGQPKARIVDPVDYERYTWSDWSKIKPQVEEDFITGTRGSVYRVPKVILLTRYNKMPVTRVNYSRREIYRRDHNTCQYCGCKPGTENLSIDHIVPKSLNGKRTWTNSCLACISCNRKKGNKTLKEAGMKLLSIPKEPKAHVFGIDKERVIKEWDAFLSEIYWSVKLENDM